MDKDQYLEQRSLKVKNFVYDYISHLGVLDDKEIQVTDVSIFIGLTSLHSRHFS